MKKYFIAKLGKSNCFADDYLTGKSEIEEKAIPIYYEPEPSNRDDLLNSLGPMDRRQCESFFECGDKNAEKYIVIIHAGEVVIVEPKGKVVFEVSKINKNWNGFVKLLPVGNVQRFSIAVVPPILASITANRYYGSGTFREIKQPGNIRAIEAVLGNQQPPRDSLSFYSLLECLCSTELETLVAKLLEEAGCFVPAYRGGNMRDADLFAHNDTKQDIKLRGLIIRSGKSVSIQVKRSSKLLSAPMGVDYLVGLRVKKGGKNFDSGWIEKELQRSPKTKAWFYRSLSWLA